MLILSRKESEQIRIGEHITLTVLRIAGDEVRIGIAAPRVMPIWRGELNEGIKRAGALRRHSRE